MRFLNAFAPYMHWFVRLSLAGTFLYHGLGKLPNAEGLSGMLGMPVLAVYGLALMETLGGLFIVIGGFSKEIFTRLAGLFLSIVMTGAILMVHWGQWGFSPSSTHPMGGMEFQALILSVSLLFLFQGNAIGGRK